MSEEEFEVEAIAIEVSSQPIELYKVLKIANVVSGGGEAKFAIAEGYVMVNGELEQRKRRKMYDGDLVEFNEEYYVVICEQPVQEKQDAPAVEVQPQSKKQAKKKPQRDSKQSTRRQSPKNTPKKNQGKSSEADKSTGRKLISF